MASKKRSRRRQRSVSPWWVIGGMVGAIVAALVLIYVTRDAEADGSASRSPSAVTTNAQPTTSAVQAPDFTLAGLDGSVSLADYRGEYVLLNFWASWCPPCMREMPDLYAYHREYQDNNFTLLAVNVAEDLATVQAFLNTNNFDFPVALDETGAIYQRYSGAGLPSSFLIGPDGTVLKAFRPGAITRAMLDESVTPFLQG